MSSHQPSAHALVNVFIEHRAQLRSLAKRVVGTTDVADDVVQDAYLRIAQGPVAANSVRQPYYYCCQVVRNIALDHCRRRTLEAKVCVNTDDGQVPDVAVRCPMAGRIDGWRLIQAIDDVLADLPPRTRQAFELFRLGELTQREIATQLGCSATLVNFMVRDARMALESLRKRRELFDD